MHLTSDPWPLTSKMLQVFDVYAFLLPLPSVIVDKMDKDQDGFVTKEELKDWIKHISRRYIYEDADSQWGTHDTDGDGGISWDEWFQSTYQAMAGTSCINWDNLYVKIVDKHVLMYI